MSAVTPARAVPRAQAARLASSVAACSRHAPADQGRQDGPKRSDPRTGRQSSEHDPERVATTQMAEGGSFIERGAFDAPVRERNARLRFRARNGGARRARQCEQSDGASVVLSATTADRWSELRIAEGAPPAIRREGRLRRRGPSDCASSRRTLSLGFGCSTQQAASKALPRQRSSGLIGQPPRGICCNRSTRLPSDRQFSDRTRKIRQARN